MLEVMVMKVLNLLYRKYYNYNDEYIVIFTQKSLLQYMKKAFLILKKGFFVMQKRLFCIVK